MTTVFVYEDVTATGAGGDAKSPPALSLLAEGRAMRDAVTADFAASVTEFARIQLSEQLNSGEFSYDQFRRLAAQADFTLVIAPETGGRLEYLCREVLRAGGRLLGPSLEAIRLTADKLALARHWEQHGVPTPPTWPLGDHPADLPVVVKPRDGAGSQAMALWAGARSGSEGGGHGSASALASASGSSPMIAQHHVPGFAASIAFLVGPGHTLPLVPCEQLLSADGRFTYRGGRLPIAPHLAGRAVRIATAAVRCVPGLAGYVGVDVVLGDDGRDWAIEINPRLTTSYVGLRALARFNLAEAVLAVVQDRPLPAMGWHDRQLEFTPDGRVFDAVPTLGGAAST